MTKMTQRDVLAIEIVASITGETTKQVEARLVEIQDQDIDVNEEMDLVDLFNG